MEASTKTVLRCVALLGMLVISLATVPAPLESSKPAPLDSPKPAPIDSTNSKTSRCAAKCGITCLLSIEFPPEYAACFGLCMVACRLIPTTYSIDGAYYGCTCNCVTSMRKVVTPIANASVSDLKSYAQGYVDSCSYSCSKNNKLF